MNVYKKCKPIVFGQRVVTDRASRSTFDPHHNNILEPIWIQQTVNWRHCLPERDRRGVVVLFRFVFAYTYYIIIIRACARDISDKSPSPSPRYVHKNISYHIIINLHTLPPKCKYARTVFPSEFKINIKGYIL